MATTADPRGKPDDHRLLPGPANLFPIPKKCANRRSVHRHFGDRAPASVPPESMTIGGIAAPAAIPASSGEEDRRLDELRAKLMGHLREAADRMKVAVAVAPEATQPPLSSSVPPEAASAAGTERPWKLRTRKKAPTARPSPQPSPLPAPAAVQAADRVQRNTRSRSEAAAAEERAAAEAAAEKEKKQPWPKVAIALTPEEVEEDVYAITGSRPRRRPKKRPRAVQRELDRLFPGLWLSEITEETYKVEDE